VRAVLFDLDGTLVDSLQGIHATVCAVLEARGHEPVDLETLRAQVGAPLEVIFGTLVPALDEAGRFAYAEHYRDLYWTTGVPRTPAFPGIEALLGELADAGVALAVDTTKRRDVALGVLEARDLTHRFPVVIGSDSTPHHKPHPAPALAALSQLAAAPDRAVVVGDTVYDVEMARAAGCRAIAAGWGYGSEDSLRAAGAELIVESIAQLRDVLLPRRP
jgi:phosphoglycolate phosphatase